MSIFVYVWQLCPALFCSLLLTCVWLSVCVYALVLLSSPWYPLQNTVPGSGTITATMTAPYFVGACSGAPLFTAFGRFVVYVGFVGCAVAGWQSTDALQRPPRRRATARSARAW